MPQHRPTFSDVEEIPKDGNYGIDEEAMDLLEMVSAKDDHKSIQEIMAQHLDAAQKVLAANHAKLTAVVVHREEQMKLEIARLRQTGSSRIRLSEDSHGNVPSGTTRVGGVQQQDVMSNGGDSGYFASSRGRWATPDKSANSNYPKWDFRSNIRETSPPGTVGFGNSDIDTVASNSRGFGGKKAKKGTPFDLASVPVPLEILANRQPPTTPLTTPAHLQDIGEVRASESKLRIASISKPTSPPGSPEASNRARSADSAISRQQDSVLMSQAESEVSFADKRHLVSMKSFSPEEGLKQRGKTVRKQTLKRTVSIASKLGSEEENYSDLGYGRNTRMLARRDTEMDLEGVTRKRRVSEAPGAKATAHVFANAEQMKEKVRAAIGKPEYNVQQFYKDSGICQRIARNSIFENVTLLVIAVNAIWIGYDTDANEATTLADARMQFQVAEHIFCGYFFLEWAVRFGAFERKLNALHDSWFLFDSALMLMMVIETWIMYTVLKLMSGVQSEGDMSISDRLGDASILKLLKLLRLTRMARMVRLLRAMPELMILIKGMFVATRSVFFTLCLLSVIIYIFGIAFTQLLVDTPIGTMYFSNISHSMNTLLLYGTLLEDTPDVANGVGDESVLLRFLFYLFILLASLTVMNMLVGVLVEVVSVVSSVEKEQLQVNFVKTRLFQMTEKLDSDSDGFISKAEFEQLLQNPEAARALRDVGVDVVGLIDYHDFLFQEDEKDLTFANFMEIVLSLRGNNQSTVKDIVDLRKFLCAELGRMSMAIQEQVFMQGNRIKASIHPRAAVHGNALPE